MADGERIRTLTVFGTRPEAIKMAPVLKALARRPEINSCLCVTGQHRDMLHQVLKTLRLQPDFDLNIMQPGQSLADITSMTLQGVTGVIAKVKPDRVIVHGDTTTTFAAALAAFYARIPVGHVEAGLRTGDLYSPWPEEFNRKSVDSFADLLWAPTEWAAKNLLSEGADPANAEVTGNTAIDAVHDALATIAADDSLRAGLAARLSFLDPAKRTILVTGHRRESFDGGLAEVCRGITEILQRDDVQVVWAVHPNPNVLATVATFLPAHDRLFLIEPEEYLGFVNLLSHADLIITDSGGIQEEAPTLGKPVLVTRWVTERPEAVAAGAARLVGPQNAGLVKAVHELLDDADAYAAMAGVANPFGDGTAGEKIAESVVRRHSGEMLREAPFQDAVVRHREAHVNG